MTDEMSLDQIGVGHGTDQSSIAGGHDYLRRLEPFFTPMRESWMSVIEIGVAGGCGTRTLRDYFKNSLIFGVDHNPSSWNLDLGSRVFITLGEASDHAFWDKFFSAHPTNEWSLVIDDAGHHSSQIISTFKYVWPKLLPGSLYVIEDLHSAGYDPAYNRDGGLNAMQFLAQLADDVNEYGRDNCGKPTNGEIEFIHLSKSMAIIKKR